MTNLIIGNRISFISAVFLGMSCYAKERKKIFRLQLLNCFTYGVTSYFFGSYAAIATLVCCCLRCIFIMKDMFTKRTAYLLTLVVIVSGVMTNNMGFIGLLPVIATAEYTLCCYYIEDPYRTRYSIMVNELIWVIYAIIIKDFSTTVCDAVVIGADIIAIINYHKAKKVETAHIN